MPDYIWASNTNVAGANASPLELRNAGYCSRSNGSVCLVGSSGCYWSSTVDGFYSRNLYFSSGSASVGGYTMRSDALCAA